MALTEEQQEHWFRLYRKPEYGEFIVCGADPAEGGDYCCATWFSRDRGDMVMSFHTKIDSAQFGYEIVKGCRFIQKETGVWPTVAVERNVGMATITRLVDLNYPALWRMKKVDTDAKEEEGEEKIGFHTSQRTRNMILDDLSMAIRQREIRIPDAECLEEFMAFIRNPKTGKAEADKSANDDWVFAVAIAWHLVLYAQKPNIDIEIPQEDLFINGFY